jgi:mannose-1-phosphate guanylyltransferase
VYNNTEGKHLTHSSGNTLVLAAANDLNFSQRRDLTQKVQELFMHDSRGQRSSLAEAAKVHGSNGSSRTDRWAVILAGGDGTRLLPLTRKIMGDDRPKQFCPIINGNTLLDETRRRISLSLSPDRTLFVLTQKHELYYNETLNGVPRENLIVQPKNAGTAPAILYSLLRLQKISPTATAAFFPSDHYFSDDRAFMADVDRAFAAATREPDRVILLGIEPESPDEEYGWIEPKRDVSKNTVSKSWPVRRFWEKPSSALARELMNRGCLWNSFVMVGKVSAFLKMIRRSTSDLFARFAVAESRLSTPTEKGAIHDLYSNLSETNFSREVLQARPGDLSVVRVGASKWSDLGSPRRVVSTLSSLGDVLFEGEKPSAQLMKSFEGNYEQARVPSGEGV